MLNGVNFRLQRRTKHWRAAFVVIGFVVAQGASALAQEAEAEAEPAPAAEAEAEPGAAAEPAAAPGAAESGTQGGGAEAEAAPPNQAITAVDERPFPPAPPQAGGAAANQNYGNQYPPAAGFPAPPPDGVYRPFSFTLGAGPGVVRLNNGPDTSPAWGISYGLRFGFGVQPDLILTLGFEGASATKNGILASQDALLVGLQYFFSQVAYLRGAMGIANETEQDADVIYVDQNGLALQTAVGIDLVQGDNVALSLEAAVMLGRYAEETWTSGGLNLLFSIY